jgi:uncharacterized protein (TIGR00369 family)
MPPSIFDAFPKPPCAELLGWRLIDLDAARGWIRVGFDARPAFRKPAGFIQGGLLAAMLDDTMGPAALVMTEGRAFTASIDMTVSFLNPARPGPLFGEGTVVQLGRTVAFLQAELRDEAGSLIARATSSARMVSTDVIPR